MPSRTHPNRLRHLGTLLIIARLLARSAAAQSAGAIRGAAAAEPLQDEPPARIVVDPPLAEPQSHGRIVIQYRTANLHVAPVFGPAALAVSPRIGHVHVTVDNAPWNWADASGAPVIVMRLTPGQHKLLIELVNANHQAIDQGTVQFTIPAAKPHAEGH